jgi:hypothetical protein
MDLVVEVCVWIFLSGAVSLWASVWGRSVNGYFLLSLFLSPVIGGVVLLIRGENEAEVWDRTHRTGFCPNCKEPILGEALECHYCGRPFNAVRAQHSHRSRRPH